MVLMVLHVAGADARGGGSAGDGAGVARGGSGGWWWVVLVLMLVLMLVLALVLLLGGGTWDCQAPHRMRIRQCPPHGHDLQHRGNQATPA